MIFHLKNAQRAALAVAWGQFFDAALPPAAGVVDLAERKAAGEPRVEGLRASEAASAASESPLSPAALLASASLALGLLALALTLRALSRGAPVRIG